MSTPKEGGITVSMGRYLDLSDFWSTIWVSQFLASASCYCSPWETEVTAHALVFLQGTWVCGLSYTTWASTWPSLGPCGMWGVDQQLTILCLCASQKQTNKNQHEVKGFYFLKSLTLLKIWEWVVLYWFIMLKILPLFYLQLLNNWDLR